MGCSSSDNTTAVPIENNVVALLVSGQTDLAIRKIQMMGNQFNPNASINFRGDTLLHYACKNNNQKFVQFLVKNPKTQKTIRNANNKQAKQLTSNDKIIKMCS